MSGQFADPQLREFVRGSPTLGAFDVATLRAGTLERARARARGPEMDRVVDLRREKATGWGLDVPMIQFFNSRWVTDRKRWSDPGVSPLHTPDLAGLPAALIVTSEHDPLRGEAEAYAERLRSAGVEVQLRREPGLVHNLVMLDEISPACAVAADRVAADLRSLLAAPDSGVRTSLGG